jgi:hypothetical protein
MCNVFSHLLPGVGILLETVNSVVKTYLTHIQFGQKSAMVQNLLGQLLEKMKQRMNAASYTLAENDVHAFMTNEPTATVTILNLNAYKPEQAEQIINYGNMVCSLLNSVALNLTTDEIRHLRTQLQSLLSPQVVTEPTKRSVGGP